MRSTKKNLFITISLLYLINIDSLMSQSEFHRMPDRLRTPETSDSHIQLVLHTQTEKESYPTHQVELSKNIYPIYLNHGGKYKVFDDIQGMGQFILEWKSLQNHLLDEYLITIRAKDGSVRLYSDSAEILEVELFDGTNSSFPITLFNLQNFSEAAIAVKVQNNTTIMRYPIQIAIPPHQWISPGTYKCFLDIGVYSGSSQEINTQTIQLSIDVDSSQIILIKSADSSTPQSNASLDFGEISTTITKDITLQIQSNIQYHLSVQSMNGSRLILAQNWNRSFYQHSSIPYDCSCDGIRFFLHHTPQKILSGHPNKKSTTCHCFSVTLHPDQKNHWEGIYEDEILFSLQTIW